MCKIIKISCCIFCVFILTGCFDIEPHTTKELCERYPELCKNFNINDGQCRVQRARAIWHRHLTNQKPSDKNYFKLLLHYKQYKNCLELASQIQLTKLKNRGVQRTIAFNETIKQIGKIERKLVQSNNPEVLYYMWTNNDSDIAKEKFLSFEGTKHLETPKLQKALASYYFSSNPDKAISILTHALALYNDVRHLDKDIIASLATLNYKKHYFHNSYLWTIIAKRFNIPVVSAEHLNIIFNISIEEKLKIEAESAKIYKSIKKGQFRSKDITNNI